MTNYTLDASGSSCYSETTLCCPPEWQEHLDGWRRGERRGARRRPETGAAMARHIKRRTFGTVLAAGSLLIIACGAGTSGQNVNGATATLRVAAAASGPFTQTFNPLLSS